MDSEELVKLLVSIVTTSKNVKSSEERMEGEVEKGTLEVEKGTLKVEKFFVQHMKARWGSFNAGAHNIRLNTDLAKKPQECLEYIVVHEMIHLLEPTHNARFVGLMDRFMPKWPFYREMLNHLPIRHEHWDY